MTKSALKPVIGTLKKVFYVNQIVSLFFEDDISSRHIYIYSIDVEKDVKM